MNPLVKLAKELGVPVVFKEEWEEVKKAEKIWNKTWRKEFEKARNIFTEAKRQYRKVVRKHCGFNADINWDTGEVTSHSNKVFKEEWEEYEKARKIWNKTYDEYSWSYGHDNIWNHFVHPSRSAAL